MHIQDLILLAIGSEPERSLRGRTILQKKLYFLSVLKKVDLGFCPHYYGPYSSWVAENLDILVNCGFLNEMTETFSSDQNVFGEIRRHTYSLTSDGDTIMDNIQELREYPSWNKKLERINSQPLANDFNKLSIASKVHYIIQVKERATTEQIRQTAREYGWQVSDSDIEEVSSFLRDLSLISVTDKA